MGDILKKKTMSEKAAEREERKRETVHIENTTIDNIARVGKKTTGKDKAISARVNGDTYKNFKKICQARGLTSNACLNMLITDFVRQNLAIIEEIDDKII